jgi:hypothetical protein
VLRGVIVALLRSAATVRVAGMVMSVRVVLRVAGAIMAGAILVMPERHALPRGDGRHPLQWDGQRQ